MSVESRLDEAREKLSKARAIARKRDARSEELAEAAKEMREVIAEKRAHRKELDEVEDEAQRERIADKIEELEGDLDRTVERLDRSNRRSKAANEELAKHNERVERLRKRRDRIKEEEVEGQLSPNFHRVELDCNNGVPVPTAALEAARFHCRTYLEPLRARFGSVHVNSGYRTAAYNASVGGASNSIHIYDQHPNAVATDVTCERGTPSEWAAFLDQLHPGGLGRYVSFTHVDCRQRIGWATSRWTG